MAKSAVVVAAAVAVLDVVAVADVAAAAVPTIGRICMVAWH